MPRTLLRLSDADLLRVFEALEKTELARERLRRQAGGSVGADTAWGDRLLMAGPRAGDVLRTGPRHLGRRRVGSGFVMLRDGRTGGSCLLPTAALRSLQAACLTGLVACELVAAKSVTAVVIGGGHAARAHVTALAHGANSLSHVVLYPSAGQRAGWPTRSTAKYAEDRGVSLSSAVDVDGALFGADLAVFAEEADMGGSGGIGRMARGAVMVNATEQGFQDRAVKRVDLLLAERVRAGAGPRTPEALGPVLLGERPARQHAAQTVLVDLSEPPEWDVALAGRLYRVALEKGLGVRTG